MLQELIVVLIVAAAVAYVAWRYLPAAWRQRLSAWLAFGERLGTGPWDSAEALLAAAADRATALVLAHPWRWGAAESFPDEAAYAAFLRRFHAVEVRSANLTPAQQAAGLAFCTAHGIPACAGSDAHSPAMAAAFATRFEKTLNNTADLAEALRAGRYSPVSLPPS